MARRMNWTEFTEILEFRAVASQAVQILDGDTKSTMSFKKELGVVTNIIQLVIVIIIVVVALLTE